MSRIFPQEITFVEDLLHFIWRLLKMPINETIKKLRKYNHLTQVEFAEKLNCNRQKIADWQVLKSSQNRSPSSCRCARLKNRIAQPL